MSEAAAGRHMRRHVTTLAALAVTGPFLIIAAPPTTAIGSPCVNNLRQEPLQEKPVGLLESLTFRGSTGIPRVQGTVNGTPGDNEDSSNPPWLKGRPGQLPIIKGHTEALHLVTGPGSPARTDRAFGIAGTDLGVALKDAEGHLMLIFGDTVACDDSSSDWRSNTIVRTSDLDYADGLEIEEALARDGWTSRGRAVEFIDSLKDPGHEHTTIPTAAITINGMHYVDYMSIREWSEPGRWKTNYAGTVRSRDGVTWSVVKDSLRTNKRPSLTKITGLPSYREGNEKLQMSSFVEHDGFVYRFSTPSGRDGSAILGRAPVSEFPDESAFRFFDGTSWFSPGDRKRNPDGDDGPYTLEDAVTIFDRPVSELSVTWNDHLSKFITLFTTDRGLVLRTAESLTGPWEQEHMIVDTGTVNDLYGASILPADGGRDLYFIATTWSNYNVLLMRTNLDELLGRVPTDTDSRVSHPDPRPSADEDYDPTEDDGLEVVGVVDYRNQ
ncbi:DUF4185 domain-containing protein [Corynebacterium sp. CCM 9203]|uniref:DUF4185 domain-containing protein n=1 Tax=Corynebacterium sp. CCM 9203 TaxID=3057615 RepID=UPI003524C2C1